MSSHPLAPVHWQMGQTLLPKHLLAQETALTAEAFLRHQTAGLPFHGVGMLEWDKYALDGGTLDLKCLRVYPSSTRSVIDYPGNASIVNLSMHFPEKSRAEVYYFVLQDNQAVLSDPPLNPTKQDISKRLYKIILSFESRFREEYEGLLEDHQIIDQGKLAEFVKDNQKHWKLSERFIPPLVQIGVSDFLVRPLQQLNILLGRFLKETLSVYQKQQLPDMRLFEMKHCVNALYESQQFIANHISIGRNQAELKMHPYFLYEHLQKLFRQLTVLSGEWTPSPLQNYRHDDLHGTFKVLFGNIVSRLTLHNRTNQSYQLHLKDGVYQALLPEVIGPKDSLYLVVNCDEQPAIEKAVLPCMSSRRRMPTLFHYSLSGVPLKSVQHSSLTHYFGDNIQCFQLAEGEELTHIINDGSLAFLAQPEFENYTFYLFYQPQTRSGSGHGPAE